MVVVATGSRRSSRYGHRNRRGPTVFLLLVVYLATAAFRFLPLPRVVVVVEGRPIQKEGSAADEASSPSSSSAASIANTFWLDDENNDFNNGGGRDEPRRTIPPRDPSSSLSSLLLLEEATAVSVERLEDLRERYSAAGCVDSWGPFPTTTTGDRDDEIPAAAVAGTAGGHGGSGACGCGLLHDLAASSARLLGKLASSSPREDDDHHPEREFGGTGVGVSFASSSEEEEAVAALEAWAAGRTATAQPVPCGEDSRAAGFACKNIDLVAHLPLTSMVGNLTTGEPPFEGNDVWGWTHHDDDDRREFVVWGVAEGHYFLEVFVDRNPTLLGFLPSHTGEANLWHDSKVIGDHAYLGSEAERHGMQIFDMRRLLSIDPSRDCVDPGYCRVLEADGWYGGTADNPVGNTHNIVANYDHHGDDDRNRRSYVYLAGEGEGCDGGLHIVDVTDPLSPTFVACFEDVGYVHDAQCVDYRGPDSRYNNGGSNTEICVCFAENKVAIADVTDKSDLEVLSVFDYPGHAYTHQGWLSLDHRFLIFGDEIDEYRQDFPGVRSLLVDIADLESPGRVLDFFGNTMVTDHNQYVASVSRSTGRVDVTDRSYRDDGGDDGSIDLIYQANYEAGLGILEVVDYGTAQLREVAYFDSHPSSTAPGFNGAWSVFPYFRSGLVAIGDIEGGLYLVKPDLRAALPELIDPPTPTPAPNPPPTPAPNPPDDDDDVAVCVDGDLAYQDRSGKDCDWVDSRFTVRRCRYVWNDVVVASVCRDTCGRAGIVAADGEDRCEVSSERRGRKRKKKKARKARKAQKSSDGSNRRMRRTAEAEAADEEAAARRQRTRRVRAVDRL
eukprot:CAMPEP_0197179728 /NCGR_PEP_ID=MMETSP1423-20130617/4576_1 /TAXON_ID=476441 /ORGANISM="Pseudo-nitzschia heimii, Strain UNC1101" /LENGTH=837 /DNA_ID=CAMNT_0042629673 /DNA_START=74 /DNA_END=2587 /DNA_ORIENTATION=+